MCGINGIVKFDASVATECERVKRMRDVLQHRGPDDSGLMVKGRVGLGHRRLSIIDLVSGQQPMSNADGVVWITYNGEIYNFKELRKQLSARGRVFTTQSDTEVILQAYEVFGEDCVQYLRGMFAFAIWDESRQKLFLARDRIGIKPLYYAVTGDELLFASEIKAILAAGGVSTRLNKAILPEYLATGFVAGEETFFQGVHKLLPGHTLSWTPAGLRQNRYWQLPRNIEDGEATMGECAREVRTRLEDAVHCHMVSDVPVGLFLSGGIDSSGLAALMAPMMSTRLQTFAVGFAEHGYNELSYARLAAKAVGAEHRETTLTASEFFEAMPRLIWHEDEPIAFASSICLNFVSRLASQHVKVVMTGEGADELFLGYNRYRVTAWNERLGRPYRAAVPQRWRESLSHLIGHLPRSLRRYAGRSFLGVPPGIRGMFYENFSVFTELAQQQLFSSSEPHRDPYAESLRYYDQAPGDMLERMSYADMQTYLVELLMKQDQMSMAASIESRVPFLDHKLVEHVAALPARYKLRGWQTKAVLREVLKDLVPREILTRKKMGFPVPLASWLRGAFTPLLQELVLGPRALARELFDATYIESLVAEHRAGAWDHSARLWMLMNLEIWQRIFLDGDSTEVIMREAFPEMGLETAA